MLFHLFEKNTKRFPRRCPIHLLTVPNESVLVSDIALINVWNGLNVTTKQMAGEWAKSAEAKKRLPKGGGIYTSGEHCFSIPGRTSTEERSPVWA
jgi:hypothetical protein